MKKTLKTLKKGDNILIHSAGQTMKAQVVKNNNKELYLDGWDKKRDCVYNIIKTYDAPCFEYFNLLNN